MAALGHDAIARLVAPDAAIMRRDPDRPADVAAQFQRAQPRCQRRGGPAGRPAHGAFGVPRVAGDAVNGVVALVVGRREGHVGLAPDHGTGPAQLRHGIGIAGAAIACKIGDAGGAAETRDLVGVLDRHRQPGQRARALAPVKGGRLGPGLVGLNLDHGVERAAKAGLPRKAVLQQFHRTDAARLQGGQCFGGGPPMGIGPGHRAVLAFRTRSWIAGQRPRGMNRSVTIAIRPMTIQY